MSMYIILITIGFLVIAFIPGLASVVGIISHSYTKNRIERLISSSIICIGISITICSKEVVGKVGLDITNYHRAYIDILNNGIIATDIYNFGFENILGYLFFIISLVFNELNIYEFIFINIIILTVAFTIFAEFYSTNKNQTFSPGYASMVLWAFSSFTMASQLLRQYYSSIFLIYSILEIGIIARAVFVLLSINTHLSALYLIILKYISISFSKKFIIFFFILGILFFEKLFVNMILNNEELYFSGLNKLEYHIVDYELKINQGDFYFLFKLCIPLFLVSFQSMINNDNKIWKNTNLNFYILIVLISIMIAPLNSLQFRLFLVVYAFLIGYVVLSFITIKPLINMTVFFLLIEIIYRLLYIESSNGLWTLFPNFSVKPFYYINYIKQ